MKSVSDVLHRTPWWGLLAGGLILLAGLAAFVTPYHLIHLEKSGATPEENRAIKREIDTTFSEGAINLSRSIVQELLARTHDPARREELEHALEEIDAARGKLREAGVEVLRAKRDAAENVTSAVQDAATAIGQAKEEAARALKDAGAEGAQARKSLEQSLERAQQASGEALRAEEAAGVAPPAPPPAAAKPPAVPQPPAGAASPAVPKSPAAAKPESKRIIVLGNDKHGINIEVSSDEPDAGLPPLPPLPPEMRAQIRKKVTGDLYRIGVGSGLILLFIPLFILAVVSKIFIDRSRAAQQLAELKRKEAEYHSMSRQVTEAKLSALQAQVEPHFLYNTLASVQALTEVDPQQANAMTGHLIQYLRNALPKMRESVSTVGQEVELVRAYLNILQMRMGKRLAFEITLPPELAEAPFPPLMLPSLVENAIKHGLEPQREGGEVAITVSAHDGRLRVSVADTGRGFADAPGAGVGLTNIRERLAALYGEAGKLTLESRGPHGVVATIEVPRGGAAPAAAGTPQAQPGAQAQPEGPRTATQRTLAAMGQAERAWRKGLSFTFVVLVVVAAVVAGLAIVGVATGALPVMMGDAPVSGATGALVGTAGIAAAFAVVVLVLAIVLAVVYGLGFILVGIALFIPLAILVSIFPAIAPFILVGLAIWWLVRRGGKSP